MIAPLSGHPAARRLAALALLALGLWIVLPPLLAPVEAWMNARASLATEREIAERLSRLAARRGAVGGLASGPDAPFLVAADAAGATSALAARLTAAAPPGAMRLTIEPPSALDPRPGAPVALRFSFEATEGALYAFLADIETAKPFLRVDDLSAVPALGVDGSILLSGSAAASAVPLLRACLDTPRRRADAGFSDLRAEANAVDAGGIGEDCRQTGDGKEPSDRPGGVSKQALRAAP